MFNQQWRDGTCEDMGSVPEGFLAHSLGITRRLQYSRSLYTLSLLSLQSSLTILRKAFEALLPGSHPISALTYPELWQHGFSISSKRPDSTSTARFCPVQFASRRSRLAFDYLTLLECVTANGALPALRFKKPRFHTDASRD